MKSAGCKISFALLAIALLVAGGLAGCGSKSGGGQGVRFENPADFAFPSDVVSVGEGGSSLAELKRLPDDAYWTVFYQDPRPMHGAEYHRSTVAPDGTIVAVGEVANFEDHTGELLIGKHSQDGQMLPGWPILYAGEGLRWNEAHDVLVDESGNLTISGYVITRGEQWRSAVWRFDPNGNILPGWPQYSAGSHAYGTSSIVDSDGNIVMCGSSGPTALDALTLWKYQMDGTPVAGWPKTFKVAKSAENFGYDLIQDRDGNLVVAGYTAAAEDGPRDAALWKLDAAANALDGWPKLWDSGMAVYDEYMSVSQEASGNYGLVGTTDGTSMDNGSLLVTTFSRDGNQLDGWPKVANDGLGWRDASPPDAWRGTGELNGTIVGAGTYEIERVAGAPVTELPETKVVTVSYNASGMMAGFPKALTKAGFLVSTRSCMADEAGNIYTVGWVEPVDGSESDNSTFIAKYPPAAYATGHPAIVTKQGISYSKLTGFSETLGSGNQGNVFYQLSPDGQSWFYWDGSGWFKAVDVLQANAAAEVDQNIRAFADEVGSGTLYIKILLVSDGNQVVKLDSIDVKQ